jgi:spermidine synthase
MAQQEQHRLIEKQGAESVALSIRYSKKLYEEMSPFQPIAVYENDRFGKILMINDVIMLSEKDEFTYHEMIVHPALCTHPNPERVLVIGGGDGGSIQQIVKHKTVKEAVLCEIDERVVRVSQEYLPTIAGKLTDPRVKILFEDGYKYVEKHENYFDVIINDLTDAIPGTPAYELFTEKYYQLVKRALRPNGMFAAQSMNTWFYAKEIKEMTQNLCKVFKDVETYIVDIPIYSPGHWTMTFASNDCKLKNFNLARSTEISKLCKYYNPEIHIGALALPNYVKEGVVNKHL